MKASQMDAEQMQRGEKRMNTRDREVIQAGKAWFATPRLENEGKVWESLKDTALQAQLSNVPQVDKVLTFPPARHDFSLIQDVA